MSIVITGNPGVGKHTITKKISEILNFPIIDINIVAKDLELFEKNENTNDVDTQKLTKILREIKLNEKIIVGHLAPYVLEKNQVEIIIILRRNPYDLESVYNERNYSEIKIKENTGSEVLGIIMHDTIEKFEEKVFQVNVSQKNIQTVVDEVLEIISKEEGGEEVDWLNLVTENNDLEKFFTH